MANIIVSVQGGSQLRTWTKDVSCHEIVHYDDTFGLMAKRESGPVK